MVDCLATFSLLVDLDLADLPERGGRDEGGLFDLI